MKCIRSLERGRSIFGLAMLAALPLAAAASPPPAQHVRGTIASVTAKSLAVTTAHGQMKVGLDPKTMLIAALASSLADVKPGTFIGTTNAERGGKNVALEVHVFPESMRGLGEGDYPWDLPSGGHASAMTNGTVGASSHSMMTNGTVGASNHSMMTNGTVGASSHSMMTNATVNGTGSGRTIHAVYKGGSRTIVIPPGTPIVKFAKATAKMLVPGAHVFVIAGKDSTGPVAQIVVAGENGVVPPM